MVAMRRVLLECFTSGKLFNYSRRIRQRRKYRKRKMFDIVKPMKLRVLSRIATHKYRKGQLNRANFIIYNSFWIVYES